MRVEERYKYRVNVSGVGAQVIGHFVPSNISVRNRGPFTDIQEGVPGEIVVDFQDGWNAAA